MEYIGWVVIGFLAIQIVGVGIWIGMDWRSRVDDHAIDLAIIIHQHKKIGAQEERANNLRSAFVETCRSVNATGKNKDYPIAAMVDALRDAESDLVYAKYALSDAEWRITKRQLKDRGRKILDIGPRDGRDAT